MPDDRAWTAVLREAAAGSPAAMAALEHVGRWLGIGLAGLVNLLNPQLIVLGGMHGRILPGRPARRRGRDHAPRAAGIACVRPRSCRPRLGADAPLLGAAELAFEPLLSDPAGYFLPADIPLHRASA